MNEPRSKFDLLPAPDRRRCHSATHFLRVFVFNEGLACYIRCYIRVWFGLFEPIDLSTTDEVLAGYSELVCHRTTSC